ncbi:probable methyltransferase TARBP1 [Polyergus mexicanus]|uniref:probable methyltransferase TARBP1 n=1 Tax=Polyergus mexicanus TaxID=615972 RepID=UPI0038B6A236
MDLHNRYLSISTLDISVLRTAANDCKHVNDIFVLHHRFVQFYNDETTREQLDINKLEICRMLLCHEYQSAFNAIESCDNKRYIIPAGAENICFSNIGAIFPPHYLRSTSEILVLHDIIALQMILYCDTELIKQHLQNFLKSSDAYFANSSSRIMYMKLLKYFLEFLCLYQFLHNDNSSIKTEKLKELGFMYLKVVKSWMKIKEEDSEWRLFASILPVLAKTFAPECILFPLWDYILNETNDLKESLIVLNIMADICFTSSCSMDLTYIHCDIYTKNAFWFIILKGLQSPLQQYRKQALYLMKKAIDSLNGSFVDSKFTKAHITPFICSKSNDKTSSIECIKQKFFLVYEALEEKQYHLVVPALTHITSLIKANKEHKFCNDCFDIVWLQCILEKVLHHENNNIVKWGVLQICKLDGTTFNEEFLELFVSVLNNTFLYEYQPNEECPEIVKELSIFFKRTKESNLFNNFLMKVSKVAWGPVAIFYIIHTLRKVSYKEIQCNWKANQLNAVKSLVETNLTMHSHILRTASQIELLRAISDYVQKIDDPILLANTLAAFPSEEGLKRGTAPWNIITTWLRKILTKEDAIIFVEDTCSKYSYEDISPEINLRTFALLIYLLHDANLILSSKTCRAEKALNNWLCMLNGINMRPYADIRSSINAIEFISHLLNLSMMESFNSVTDLILLYVHTTFKFLIKNVRKMATELTYEDYTRYIAIVSSHMVNATLFMPKKDVKNYAENLQNESICLLKDTQHQNMQYLYGLYILHLSQNVSVLPLATTFYTEYLLNMQPIPVNVNNDNVANLRGKIASEYYLLLSKLMRQYLVNSPMHLWISTATLLSNLLKFLELGGTDIISEIASILIIMIDNKVINYTNDRETLEYIFKSCWRCTLVNKKNNVFWTAMQNLTGVIINNNFFILPNATNFITEFVDQLIEEGESTPKFKRILLSKMKQLNECNLLQLEKPLLSCLLHGSVLRRDKRIENYAHLFIIKHLGQYYPKHILALDHNNDAAVRAEATILLHKIISHLELNYAAVIVPLILEILEKYKNKRYFNDSYLHKLKHRLMQILLILEPVLTEELVALLQEKLCDLILSESNQHSVRLMQEWSMIRIFKKHINLHNKLWKFFTKSIEERPGCTISVASIIYHVAQLLSNDNQKKFIHTALPYIVQCCLGQQFNMRFYNQFIFIQLYELMKKANDDDSISKYKGIYQAAMANLQQDSLTKNSIKIQDDFYFSSFNPINDYSLQTIYYELPRLTNISSDEWISPDIFEAFMFEHNDNHSLQLYNVDLFLSETKTSIYLTKSLAGDTESLTNNVETYLEGLHDIQKKIDPSKSMTPLYSDIFESMKESIYQQDLQLHEEGLIVVASFISRPPNLGGITRTCEIFGVKTLVIANLDCIKDKEFQCLSVSAEKWINMLQMKPQELQKYLFEKKNAGWSLIGVEQTANSINLLQTKFEKKTILILGNEKDGIPANFIPLFDMCVEIPQVGVIRSLNVHVTAAICIWQYASQHTLKQ